MKTNIITLILLAAAVLTACTGQQKQPATATESYDFPLVVAIDSIGVSMTLKSDLPQDTLLQRTLAQFVCEQMFFDTDDNDRPLKPLPVYQGDFQDFVRRCAAMKWDELAEATFGEFPTQEELDANPEQEGISRQEEERAMEELTEETEEP